MPIHSWLVQQELRVEISGISSLSVDYLTYLIPSELARSPKLKSVCMLAEAERIKRNVTYAAHEYKTHTFDILIKKMIWPVLYHYALGFTICVTYIGVGGYRIRTILWSWKNCMTGAVRRMLHFTNKS
jgi:hypothetical protein